VAELAVVEPNQTDGLALSPSVEFYATLEEGLDWQPAIVFIASPTQFHLTQTLVAARHGCDVFIEKPLSHTATFVDELIRELRDRGLISLVGCNMRFHPGPATVKRLLVEGAAGEIISARLKTGSYLPDWRPGTNYRDSYSASAEWGGAILDCIHEIDLSCWLFGAARLSAAAWRPATTLDLRTDGVAELLLEHECGIVSSVHLNFMQRDYERTCEVIGSEGTIRWDFNEKVVSLTRRQGHRPQFFPQPCAWDLNQMYFDEVAHFLECVIDRRETCNPVSKAASVLSIALGARVNNCLTVR
jgi:predicted dehydrogenase